MSMLAQWPRIIAHFEAAIRRHPGGRSGIVGDRGLCGWKRTRLPRAPMARAIALGDRR